MTDTFRALCAELLQGLDENRHPEVRYPGHLRIIMDRARTALAQPEPAGEVMGEELDKELEKWLRGHAVHADQALGSPIEAARFTRVADLLQRQQPVAVGERLPASSHTRFEFSVFNDEYEEQAGGSAPTYAEALGYGEHYLAQYQQDGPHTLELRRVEVLAHDSPPTPPEARS